MKVAILPLLTVKRGALDTARFCDRPSAAQQRCGAAGAPFEQRNVETV
jgi:hypothetical protein